MPCKFNGKSLKKVLKKHIRETWAVLYLDRFESYHVIQTHNPSLSEDNTQSGKEVYQGGKLRLGA